jgi:hypothetical protein
VPGVPKDCKQRLFSFKYLEFLKWVWDFDKKHRQAILDVLAEYKGKKAVYTLTSFDECDEFIDTLESQF